MGTFGVHNLTMRRFRSGKISHTLKNGSKWVLSGHTISPCDAVLKNGSKWVLSGHTISPCSSVLKNGSKWVLSGYTTSPCNNLDQAKFLTHSKMGLNGYFQGTQSHHAALYSKMGLNGYFRGTQSHHCSTEDNIYVRCSL